MEGIGQINLLLLVGIGLLALSGLLFFVWMMAAISAICDDLEGVRDE